MNRRNALALLLALLILPFTRFLEKWKLPEFRRTVNAGMKQYSSVRLYINDVEVYPEDKMIYSRASPRSQLFEIIDKPLSADNDWRYEK